MEDKCPKWIMRLKNNQVLGKILIVSMLILLALALTRCSLIMNNVIPEQETYQGQIINFSGEPVHVYLARIVEDGKDVIYYNGLVGPRSVVKIHRVEPGVYDFRAKGKVSGSLLEAKIPLTLADLKRMGKRGLLPTFFIRGGGKIPLRPA